jgi:hypothetical protein
MRYFFLIIFSGLSVFSFAQLKTTGPNKGKILPLKGSFVSFGIDYRWYPTDIENVPPGPIPRSKGLPSEDFKFWKPISLYGQFGYKLKKNWSVTASFYSRYNFFHRIENINNTLTSPTTAVSSPNNPKSVYNFKYDFFLDIEKKLKLRKHKERYFLIQAGVGFTNINSRFDVTLTDSLEHRTDGPKRYHGTLLHFGPRASLGYQHEKLKLYLKAFMIENPLLTNLTSIWLGGSLGYELPLKRKKSNR